MSLVYLLLSLVLAITIHEFMHAWVANYLGDQTAKHQGRLTLNPLAHIDPFMTLLLPAVLILIGSPVVFLGARPVPFNPWAVRFGKWGSALVAIAGPLTNLVVASFFALWLRLFSPAGAGLELIITLIKINVAVFVFNLIPFPPLDGSRVLYAVAPLGLREVMDRIERGGVTVLIILLFVMIPIVGPVISNISGHILQVLIPGLTGL